MNKYISDIVTVDEVKSWKSGQVITIEAGCGKGKSHFIKNTLYDIAKENNKKILFLLHRTNCIDQFQLEMEYAGKLDVIDIKTYQKIESDIRKGWNFDFSRYEYICSDEYHYFFSDSQFNNYTDLSLRAILDQTNITRIFMSATGDSVKRYINKVKKVDIKEYSLPIDYSFVKSLYFYNSDESLETLVQQAINENRKTIFFIESAVKGYILYKKFKKHTMFNCGKNDVHYKHVDKEKVTTMLKEERFDDLILITTTAMSTGVNIKDDDLRHIVCDVKDTGTLIQCIGRKRLMKDTDYIHVCIKNISNRSLGGYQTQYEERMKMARYLNNHTPEEYVKEYPRVNDRGNIVYTDTNEDGKGVTLKINYLTYFKYLLDHAEMSAMTGNNKIDYGYSKYIARLFGKFDKVTGEYDFDIVEKEDEKMKLADYLESVVGEVMLTLKDRQELVENVNVKQDRKLLKSLESLNAALREKNIDYYIKQFETSRMIDGKKKKYKSAWKVMKLVD